MTEILRRIAHNSDAFRPSAFSNVTDSITKTWICEFIGIADAHRTYDEQLNIVCSLFYQLVDELHTRGCTAAEVCKLGRLSAKFWSECLGRSLAESLVVLKSVVDDAVNDGVSDRAARIFAEYTTGSFLQHFHLYKVCLADSKREIHFKRIVTVETPTCPPPLKDGRTPEEHEYFERLRQIEVEEELERRKNLACQSGELAQIHRRQSSLTLQETPLPKQQRDAIISDIVDANVKAEAVKLNGMMENSNTDLLYKVKRTALPRPASLGPPPRFATERKSASSTRSSAKSKETRRKGK